MAVAAAGQLQEAGSMPLVVVVADCFLSELLAAVVVESTYISGDHLSVEGTATGLAESVEMQN